LNIGVAERLRLDRYPGRLPARREAAARIARAVLEELSAAGISDFRIVDGSSYMQPTSVFG